MGYFPVPGGGSGHVHANKAVLDALQSAGSGAVISAEERTALGAPFTPPPGTEAVWGGTPPTTLHDAVSQLAIALAQHFGSYPPQPPTT